MTPAPFAARLEAVAVATEARLAALLGATPETGEIARPDRLLAAMRHAALGGGKRLRPFLLVESAALFGIGIEDAIDAATALECVHDYSLVHDDLPAMDDDDMRRGLPTVHKAFDEATAILVGDSLLTLAFDLLSRPSTHPDPAVRVALVACLARASGLGGMAGGQMLDLAAEGRYAPDSRPLALPEHDILRLQAMKTGALIRAACEMGAIVARASDTDRAALVRYGLALGAAFQIADDLIDREADAAIAGKATGKDAELGKATLVDKLGIEGARARLASLVADADAALAPFGERAAILRAGARFVAERKN